MPKAAGEAQGKISGRIIIGQLVRNTELGQFEMGYSILAPCIFSLYLHPDDYTRLTGVLPWHRASDLLPRLRRCCSPMILRSERLNGKLAGARFGFAEGGGNCDNGQETAVKNFDRITVDPAQMGGVPCVRGLRIPVATVLRLLAGGLTEGEILAEYPDLESEDIRECLRFAAAWAMERELPLPHSA
jgi:uncharacterized protein (DUF433 family)